MFLVHFFDWLLFFPVVISFGLMLYALSRRSIVSARPFALTMAGWFLWAFGYLLELNVTNLPSKIFWDNFQFLGIDLAVAGALLFALVYSGQIMRLRPVLLLLSLFLLLNLVLVWSNERHQLVRSNAELQALGAQVYLIYDYGPWFWTGLAYTYLLIGITLTVLVRFAMCNRLHRSSVFTFVLGLSAPTLGGLITVAGLVPIANAERLDISPLTFAISGPLMAWGLFRKRGLLDLVPIARSLLIDQMLDGTLVSDQFGRIVDANPQAHVLLRYAPGTLPGQKLVNLAPLIAALTTDPACRHGELRLEGDVVTVLDVTVTSLQGAGARQLGWLVVLRDSTERTALIDALRMQGADLERQGQYHRVLAACSQMLLREIRTDSGRDEVLTQALEMIRNTINISRVDLCENILFGESGMVIAPIAKAALSGLPACPFNRTLPCQLPARISATLAQGESCSGASATLFAANTANALADAHVNSILLLPVEVDGIWWGVLVVSSDQPEHLWDVATVDFLHTAATMLASFIQHSAAITTLHEREHFIQQINHTTPDIIYVYDLVQQQPLYFNQTGLKSLGYLIEQVRTINLLTLVKIIHPDDYQRFRTHHTQLLAAADRAVHTIEYRVWDAQGRLRWMFSRDTIFRRDEQGQPRLILGIVQEITARKEAELALQSSELRLRALLAALPDLMFLLSPEGILLDYRAPQSYHDSHSAALLNAPNELLGSRLEAVLSADLANLIRRAMRDLSASGQLQVFDYTLTQPDQAHIYEARLVSAGAEGVLMMVRDVTETRRSTETLRHAKEQAEAADRAKSMFVAQMSHEIRTPLNTVIGMTELLMETALSEEQHEYATMIGTGGRSLLAIVNDILDLARIESGRIELAEEPFSLVECLEESLDLVRYAATSKGLALQQSLTPDLPKLLLGDAARLRQILVNLLSNAIKFTKHGVVTLAATCQRETADGQYLITLVVQDTGIGIAPEQMIQIFAPFVQADSSISRRYGGTGLGLTISRKLAALMQGELSVESVPELGSSFTLRLRLQAFIEPTRALLPAGVGTAAALVVDQSQSYAVHQGHILIVEDNPINQEVLRRMLMHLGYSCDIASNGLVALEIIHEKTYQIVFMDVQMPELDGVAATQLIRALGNQIEQPVIIAVTASALPGDRERYLQAGMNAYLSKPIKLEVLIQVLKNID